MVQEEKSSTQQRGPGDVLRAARESAGMSVEQVADKLHLLQSVVSSLEKDCYDRIRGETFVRGYLRNYARLLGVDAEDVLSRHRLANPAGKSEARTSARKRDRWHGASGAGRVGMVLMLLAVSALFLFQNREPQAAVPEPGAAAVTIETASGPQVVRLLAPPRAEP